MVPERADVSRPRLGDEAIEVGLAGPEVVGLEAAEEVVEEGGDVAGSGAEGRNPDLQDAKALEEIEAKRAGAGAALEVPPRGGYDPYVDSYRTLPADRT
jgi:hypothetical protein